MDLKELKLNDELKAGRHPWELARLNVISKLLNLEVLPKVKDQQPSVLDMGCGDTFFVENLSQKIPNAKFIAIDTAFENDILERVREKLSSAPIEVFESINDIPASYNKKFSLVLLLDVIEHIENDIEFLKWLKGSSLINKDTTFIITVPAFSKLFCSHDVFLGHYRRYNNDMLNKHLEEAGFEVIKIGYFFFFLLPFRFVNVLVEKLLKGNSNKAKGIGGWKGGKLAGILFEKALIADYGISQILRKFGIKLPGLSNYVICKPLK